MLHVSPGASSLFGLWLEVEKEQAKKRRGGHDVNPGRITQDRKTGQARDLAAERVGLVSASGKGNGKDAEALRAFSASDPLLNPTRSAASLQGPSVLDRSRPIRLGHSPGDHPAALRGGTAGRGAQQQGGLGGAELCPGPDRAL